MSDNALDNAIAPPDWAAMTEELACPLCGYNLRGLVEPRCPECGFAFTWNELLDERCNRHPYLFEHQSKHNIWSFWKTFWRDCHPRRFWREVSPANPVRLKRLLIYWILANSAMLAMVLAPTPAIVWNLYREMVGVRAMFRLRPGTNMYASTFNGVPISATQFNSMYPLPSSGQFWLVVIRRMEYSAWGLAVMAALLWPWLTFASLLIFQASMRRAGIRQSHVLRTVVYSCDFWILLGCVSIIATILLPGGQGWEPFFAMMFCPVVVLYRLTIAYKRYLRFDLPFLTVLASQVIVLLAVFALLLNVDRL